MLEYKSEILTRYYVISTDVKALKGNKHPLLFATYSAPEKELDKLIMIYSFIIIFIDLLAYPLCQYFWQVEVLFCFTQAEIVFLASTD